MMRSASKLLTKLCALETECRRRIRGPTFYALSSRSRKFNHPKCCQATGGGSQRMGFPAVRCPNGQQESATAKANDNQGELGNTIFYGSHYKGVPNEKVTALGKGGLCAW